MSSVNVTVFTGPMGSGKSLAALTAIRLHSYNPNVVIKTIVHARTLYDNNPIDIEHLTKEMSTFGQITDKLYSRGGDTKADYMEDLSRLESSIDAIDVLVIDEFHFFDEKSVDWLIKHLKKPHTRERVQHIYICCVSSDYRREPIGYLHKMIHLVNCAYKIFKATCYFCLKIDADWSFALKHLDGQIHVKKEDFNSACGICYDKNIGPDGVIY